jgi:hypothetical protein
MLVWNLHTGGFAMDLKLQILLYCAIQSIAMPSAYAVSFELETNPTYGQTMWHNALSPNNSEVIGTINNRPFAFDGSLDFHKEQALAEPVLKEALVVAVQHRQIFPGDLVDCLFNLGCFYLIAYDQVRANECMKQAIQACRDYNLDKKPSMPSYLDHAALLARANGEFHRANALYQEAMDRRARMEGDATPDIAHSNINFASLASDIGTQSQDANTAKSFDAERARRESIANEIMSHVVFVDSKVHHNNQPRHFVPSSTVNKGQPTLPMMVAYAKSVIDKHKKPVLVKLKPPGIGTVIGNWSVPTDINTTSTITTETTREETIDGDEKTSGSSEQTSQIAGVEIFACPLQDYGLIWNRIASFGASKGLDIKDFGTEWPANHKQGEALLRALKEVARQISVESVKTDKNGDYELPRVPRGTYFLYAGLVTREKCRLWLMPSITQPIVVSRIQQFKCDFTSANATTIWARNSGYAMSASTLPHSSAPQTAGSVSPPPLASQL